ncbi:MAG: zinc ABC transporter substrate-binding protein, partial [Nitrosopumilaceae archaeon]
FHKAFSYFAVQYELNQHTIINSNNPNIEPTSKTLVEIINLAKNSGINVIFTEEAVDARTSEVIATEIGARVLVLSTMEIMNENSNYIMKMENNLSNLKEALCT